MSHRPEVTEGCNRLPKNAVVCWKPLDLTQRISGVSDADTRTALPEWVAAGSAVSWHQINPLGETHFSERETPGLAFRVARVEGRPTWVRSRRLMRTAALGYIFVLLLFQASSVLSRARAF